MPNFQIAISQESLGVRSLNFQSSDISMIPINGAKMKKFWEVRVSSSKKIGWFDMELPNDAYVNKAVVSVFGNKFRTINDGASCIWSLAQKPKTLKI